MSAAPRRLLRTGPVSTCWEVGQGPERCYEKDYRVLWPWVLLRGLVRFNLPPLGAHAEARNIARLARAGVAVPRVLALERRWRPDPLRLGLWSESRLRLAPMPGRSLEHLLPAWRAARAWRRRRALARALGALVARMHAAGVFHRDLYVCHVYHDEASGALGLIDLARAGRRLLWRRRWRIKDLAALWYSREHDLYTRADAVAFLRAYLDLPPRGPGARLPAHARALVRAVRRKAARMGRRARRRGDTPRRAPTMARRDGR
ncbi:MAG: hypothetical protein D6776_06735 [Planctomycetota bacterium]|nr:MAG: hypothetical protein D6776_06735 [Planctomycetota bacterium]